MNIVIISTSDIGHGAGISAYRLHRALLSKGVDSGMIVSVRSSDDDTVFPALSPPGDIFSVSISRAMHFMEYALNTMALQNVYSVNGRNLLGHDLVRNADVVHFHNIHWTVNNFSLLHLKDCRKPLVWTFHDMWPITGHCFYSNDCKRWRTGCGKCPDLDILVKLKYDSTRIQWKFKKWIYERSGPVIVAPSRWMYDQVKCSSLLKNHRVENIPYGVDREIFKVRDKEACRRYLGLNAGGKVIFFVANFLHEQRKGYKYFEKAMMKYHDNGGKASILTAGNSLISGNLADRYDIKALGNVKDPAVMAKCFSAADIFVMPSIQDNLPNVVLESLSCGTPVVAFRAGGIPDMVEHMSTGYLAETRDPESMADGIKLLLDDDPSLLRILSGNAQDRIHKEFTLDLYAERHIELYEDILKKNK